MNDYGLGFSRRVVSQAAGDRKGFGDSLFQAVLFETVQPFSLTTRFRGRGGREAFFPFERIIQAKIGSIDGERAVIGDFFLGSGRG
jgi:hypothetical protein